ncbi:MAG: transporter substrate-binding domain-containing protein [Deltaproteobacteria bacterium]|nr:transporter substrate-binding domain-containing protein [Deltaproteobacteria bacterium]
MEITEEAFKRVGYAPEFKFLPWIRALDLSLEGKYDVLLGAYYTQERAEKMTYSEPIGKTEKMLLKLKEKDIRYKTLEELKPYRIGYIRGAQVSREFEEAEKAYLNVEYVVDTEMNIRKLLSGRIDLVVEKKERIIYLLDTVFKKDRHKVEFIYPPLAINYFYNCVSKILPNHREIVDDFNRGLKILREDGTEEKILKKYGIYSE